MKRIIEIDKDLYESIAGKNTDQVEPRQVVRSFQATIADAIAQSTPYNPTGDCISRELLKKDIEAQISDFNELNKKGEPYKDFKDIRAILFGLVIGKNLIDNAPPVVVNCKDCDGYEAGLAQGKQDRPHGEWLKEDNGKTTDVYRCSICGRSIMLCKNADLSKYPFCHCGADMQKGGAE